MTFGRLISLQPSIIQMIFLPRIEQKKITSTGCIIDKTSTNFTSARYEELVTQNHQIYCVVGSKTKFSNKW
jgi:hypothetical protein